MRAPAAVARTPRADAAVDRLVWSLVITGEYDVVGWSAGAGSASSGSGTGLTMDAGYGAAAVWVADVVQGRLAGHEFVQGRAAGSICSCRGWSGRRRCGLIRTTGATIAPGELCAHGDR
ncbi:hypothetical protein SAMN05421776_101980 [Nocardia farcinica]|uniref:Uncharacterized protein n=1 Tax=Nocardia farcinica TaxID=37329 RepID=A0A0H5P167_NOCFR|nr:hypothetical protein [Nocardia farcinica]AXK85081.1 hypothetical protein DXT66_05060 [Nocardia farcinica]CRY76176.1 Uncharacterised protein [Nocardia farcinica]SIS74560.1 hypothetical protein SAMN05421776_101980 [Nocardia farcinica]